MPTYTKEVATKAVLNHRALFKELVIAIVAATADSHRWATGQEWSPTRTRYIKGHGRYCILNDYVEAVARRYVESSNDRSFLRQRYNGVAIQGVEIHLENLMISMARTDLFSGQLAPTKRHKTLSQDSHLLYQPELPFDIEEEELVVTDSSLMALIKYKPSSNEDRTIDFCRLLFVHGPQSIACWGGYEIDLLGLALESGATRRELGLPEVEAPILETEIAISAPAIRYLPGVKRVLEDEDDGEGKQ